MSDRTRTRIFVAGLVALFGAMFLIGTLSAQNTVTVNPLIVGSTSIQRVGSASGENSTFRPGGLVDFVRDVTDTAAINEWQTLTLPLGAGALARADDSVLVRWGLLGAANANTHEYQTYFSLATATCGGTAAALCNSGCIILPSVTNTTSTAAVRYEVLLTRLTATTQDYERAITGTNQAWFTGGCTIDLAQATKFTVGSRNTSAAAASMVQMSAWLFSYPAP